MGLSRKLDSPMINNIIKMITVKIAASSLFTISSTLKIRTADKPFLGSEAKAYYHYSFAEWHFRNSDGVMPQAS